MTTLTTPHVSYSAGADAICIQFDDDSVAWTQEVDDRRMVDWAVDGRLLGIELLDVSDGIVLQDLPERQRVEEVLRVFTFPVVG